MAVGRRIGRDCGITVSTLKNPCNTQDQTGSNLSIRVSHNALYYGVCRMSHVACRMSHVACRMSRVACRKNRATLGHNISTKPRFNAACLVWTTPVLTARRSTPHVRTRPHR
ncbi:hypothetical protein B0T26DRAFT_219224 [Lasiosphaeria miniovina]|uniref:Uncharacterized protein n=1 Tax=Lasiosphaeria miniovina TaxID=1954250 RepID=A0AA40E375_9PEZI|nr:uncharacterized protein B0T26DRAFT_219224 [Lasiosphaeria miniovina]KAK0722451.1 hypothetical protein B0T26DRAFT_219224 [Lasiosphaeria miniovina]